MCHEQAHEAGPRGAVEHDVVGPNGRCDAQTAARVVRAQDYGAVFPPALSLGFTLCLVEPNTTTTARVRCACIRVVV